MRTCAVCNEKKDLKKFHRNKRFPLGYAYTCIQCFNIGRNGKWKREPTKRHEYYLKNRTKQLDRDLFKHYGITRDKYNEMLLAQDSLCAICGKHASESNKGLHVDHCHETKVVRGLLCNSCNLAIGLLKHNKTIIQKSLEYLGQ